jgi:1-acyl-sn-glycerol-3-phosphate acyltransferase
MGILLGVPSGEYIAVPWHRVNSWAPPRRMWYTCGVRGASHRSGALIETWGRRLITIPLYCLLCALVIATLPLLLGLAAIVDLLRGGPWAAARCVAFFAFYLVCEVIGVCTSFVAWIATGCGTARARFLRWNFALECCWARTLLRGAQRIFGMRVEVEEPAGLGRGPMILFIRHASVGDTVLPAVYISGRYGIVLRYVLKRELLWDPCLDIVGNRLRNCFVRRGSGEGAREIALVQNLMEDLGPTDGVLIYPEGTRFTPAKRQQILQRLTEKADTHFLERARALQHVLPPRLGGALALLERNAGADAVFCAHVGFEGASGFRDLLNGSLVNRLVRVCFWRVPYAEIPRAAAARADWLYDQWARIDTWLGGAAGSAPQRARTGR